MTRGIAILKPLDIPIISLKYPIIIPKNIEYPYAIP
jgi:hypothetical protein